jgi:hypothetical protein
MSVAFAIASGSSLTSRNEPTPFTATLPVIAISVSVPISQSLSLEERAWRDGAFLYPYLRSTKNGNTYTLVRDGGWPQVYDSLGKLRPIAVYVDEDASGGQGGNLNPVPGFEAWYVLDPIRKLVDQTGNAHTLSGSGTNVAGPNLGMVAQTSLGLTEAFASAVWRTNGAISLVALVNIAASAGDRWFASCELNGSRNTCGSSGLARTVSLLRRRQQDGEHGPGSGVGSRLADERLAHLRIQPCRRWPEPQGLPRWWLCRRCDRERLSRGRVRLGANRWQRPVRERPGLQPTVHRHRSL